MALAQIEHLKHAVTCLLLLALGAGGAWAADDISASTLYSNRYRSNAHDTRKYGDYFRDQYVLHATANEGWVDIELTKSDRAPGGPEVDSHQKTMEELKQEMLNPDLKGDDPVIRTRTKRVLCRVRVEIVAPAPGNFLDNPGRQYRVTMQGVEVAPDYSHIFTVNADKVLDKFENEFWELYRRCPDSMEREAVFNGMGLAEIAYKDAQLLPPHITLTVLNSESGRAAIQGPFMSHQSQHKLDRFKSLEEGQALNSNFETDLTSRSSDTRTRQKQTSRQKSEQAQPGQTNTSKPTRAARSAQRPMGQQFGGEMFKAKTAADYHEQQLLNFNAPERRKEKLGQRMESLAGRDKDYQPGHAASMETYQLLTGSSGSAISARAGAGR